MLSIIIPTLNEEKYLPRLLESIKRQNFSDYEIIVSDGGSDDSTEAVAKSFNTAFIVDSSVRHPSVQRNNGAKVSQGETLLFLDADTVLPERFLPEAYEEFLEKDLAIAGFYIKFNPNRFHYNIYSFISNIICGFKQYTKHPAAIGAGLMSKRSVHEVINGFDLKVVLAEDYDYCVRASRVGKFKILTAAKILYSSRRIEKEGFLRAGWKWLRMGIFTMTNRTIKKQIIKYDFGKFKE